MPAHHLLHADHEHLSRRHSGCHRLRDRIAPATMVTSNVRLVRPLAEGGMGSIWVADHLGLEAQVAVKFIDPELLRYNPAAAARFRREASLSARLASVHVVRSFDTGRMRYGTPYIVMELLEGSCLEEWLAVCDTLSLRETALVVKQAAKALHRAHLLGIVHRDIKPDNIFLCDNDYELFVKVLDFGVAKRQWDPTGESDMTLTGAVVGTPGYMSPEQAVSSKDIDHRADLWSLAAVAYRALTGEEPYADIDEELPFARMMRCDLTPATHLVPTLPDGVDAWFARALHPDADQRFGSALELARSFAALVCDRLSYDPLSGELAPRSSRGSLRSLYDEAEPIIASRSSSIPPRGDEAGDEEQDAQLPEHDDVDETPTRPLFRAPIQSLDERTTPMPLPEPPPFPYGRVFALSAAVTTATIAVVAALGQLAALWY